MTASQEWLTNANGLPQPAPASSCRKEGTTQWGDRSLDQLIKPMLDTPSVVLLTDERWLSPDLADALAEAGRDWISILHPDWDIEVDRSSLLGLHEKNMPIIQARLAMRDLLPIMLQALYPCRSHAHPIRWLYTCCVLVVGLGKVRVVVGSTNSDAGYTLWVTNRLDWSAHTVIRHWFNGCVSSQITSSDEAQTPDHDRFLTAA